MDGLPERKQNAFCAVAHFSVTLAFLGRRVAIRHGGRKGEGEDRGRDRPQVRAAAGFATLRLGLAGRDGEDEDEQKEEKGGRRDRQRHGGVGGVKSV